MHQTLIIDGKRYVLLPEQEFDELRAVSVLVDQADLPPLPEADADGNVPGVAFARAHIAREIILRRRKTGLTQAELAERAGVRVETISRLENAKHSADPSTVEKLDVALEALEEPRRRRAGQRRKASA